MVKSGFWFTWKYQNTQAVYSGSGSKQFPLEVIVSIHGSWVRDMRPDEIHLLYLRIRIRNKSFRFALYIKSKRL